MTPTASRPTAVEPGRPPAKRPFRPSRLVLHLFLALVALGWLLPLLLAVYASLRPYEETARFGYFSLPRSLTLDYYGQAWSQADLPKYYLNTLIIVVPGVILTLLMASFTAFAIARLRIPGRKVLLVVFTAGNLLPPQVLITPLYTLYTLIPLPWWLSDSLSLYDSYLGLILIHVAFQFGFCVFVLANFMRTIPEEISEAAMVDGGPACGDATGSSRCRCAVPHWRRCRRCSSPGCTTTSSGRWC